MIHVAVIARTGVNWSAPVPSQVVVIGEDGPAMARNRALEACDDEVLALLEDDVEPAPGWLDALTEAWASADADVAIIGGPLDGAPRVDGPAATYPGANVSFRAAALRGAGGFWPARGHPDQRDWFSEEHEAQRELLRIGWRSAFAPGAAARRTTVPGVRARFRTGARRQVVGEPRRRTDLLRDISRGRNLAESLGALLGRARHDFEPVASSTPFLPSVPMKRGQTRFSRSVSPPRVLLYHRIAYLESDPLGLAVTPQNFAEQLEVLRTRPVVPLEQITDAPPGALAVTFDDGYEDNRRLRNAGIPITLFVSTGHLEEQRSFWWDQLDAVCRARTGTRIDLEDRAFILGDRARHYIHQWLQPRAPDEIAAALDALGVTEGPDPSVTRALTVDELQALAEHVAIGAHTRNHRSLRHAPEQEQRDEIERSRDDIERWLGRRPTAFSYPFGMPGDAFDETAMRLVREAGFTHAVANAPEGSAHPFALPRHAVPDVDGERFARWLDGRGP